MKATVKIEVTKKELAVIVYSINAANNLLRKTGGTQNAFSPERHDMAYENSSCVKRMLTKVINAKWTDVTESDMITVDHIDLWYMVHALDYAIRSKVIDNYAVSHDISIDQILKMTEILRAAKDISVDIEDEPAQFIISK